MNLAYTLDAAGTNGERPADSRPAIRLLLADDHQLFREGMKALLAQHADITVVGEAGDGRTAVRLTLECEPDVVLMDVAMPIMNGIEAMRTLRRLRASARVVMLTARSSSELVHQALDAGAQGYVVKEADSGDVVRAVRAAYVQERYLCPRVEAIAQRAGPDSRTSSPAARLTARERQVLQLVVEGYSSSQIAALVHLSPKSVDTYRSRLMHKLGVSNVALLVRFAIQHGLVSFDDDL